MANTKTYNLDPNVFLPTSQSGVAQHPGDRTAAAWSKILADCNDVGGRGNESLDTAGALALDVYESRLLVNNTMAFSLAAPTLQGQRKLVRCITAANTPAATLTVSSPDDTAGFICPTTFFFDNVGQMLELEATPALKWRCIQKQRTGMKTLTVGSTATTGICDMSHVALSVTGTVSSTGANALPNGAAVGEILTIGVTTAALSPSGTLGGTYIKKDGTAGTTLSVWVNATDQATLVWTGAGWKALTLIPAALVIA